MACARLLASLVLSLSLAGCGDSKSDSASADATLSGTQTSAPMTGAEPTTSATTDGATSTTGDATTATGGSTGGAPGACACIDGEESFSCGDDLLAAHITGCPSAQPCGAVTVTCSRPNEDLYFCMKHELVFDDAALTCALTALRDRTPGQLLVEGFDDPGIFAGATIRLLRIREDAAVVTSACQMTDTGAIWSATASTLAPPAFFDGCLAETEALKRYECLFAGLTDTVVVQPCG